MASKEVHTIKKDDKNNLINKDGSPKFCQCKGERNFLKFYHVVEENNAVVMCKMCSVCLCWIEGEVEAFPFQIPHKVFSN